jgi:hypothetical protein
MHFILPADLRFSFPGPGLQKAIQTHGAAEYRRSDNGSEFSAHTV